MSWRALLVVVSVEPFVLGIEGWKNEDCNLQLAHGAVAAAGLDEMIRNCFSEGLRNGASRGVS